MLRITESASVQLTTIYLEGKLLSPWIQEVGAAVVAAQARGVVRLNLAELSFADRAGVDLLKEMHASGVELTDGSVFIEGLLGSPTKKTA